MSKLTKEKKLQIIKAAAKRFDKHGIGKTTLNEIARDLRIGKATLYGYFESKENIFFSVLEWEGSQYLEEVKAIFDKEDIPVRNRFLEYFKSKENLSQRYKLMIDSIFQVLEDKALEPEIAFVKNLFNNEEELIKSVLLKAKGIKENALDSSLPVFIILKSWGLGFSSKLQRNSRPDKISPIDDILLKLIDYYLL
ncbi:MAG: TetR/AcrR family transcriptional regulator [Ignavibacteriaceae bacterium]|nr:TetR/AcrR family transcriptional regulator [Ignavibacteriaceae bacterium]